jgi:hypothetical protein
MPAFVTADHIQTNYPAPIKGTPSKLNRISDSLKIIYRCHDISNELDNATRRCMWLLIHQRDPSCRAEIAVDC